MKWLKDVHPSFSKHVWERNGLVQSIAMERFGGIDVLENPVCANCERPGAWHDNDSCYCFACGHVTPKNKTKTLYRYIAEDSLPKGMHKKDMELLQNMLIPEISGDLRKLFERIEHLEDKQYEEELDETEIEVIETIIDENEDFEDDDNTL